MSLIARIQKRQCTECVCVCVSYTLEVLHVDVVQPTQVFVGLQEAGELLMLSDGLRQQLPSLPLLHVPAEQEVRKVLQETHARHQSYTFTETCAEQKTKSLIAMRFSIIIKYTSRD